MQLFNSALIFASVVTAFTPLKNGQPLTNPNALKVDSAPSGSKLSYYGGPIVSAVEVFVIYWGGASAVAYSGAQIESFYGAVTKSPWFDIHHQYTSTTSSVGDGSFIGSYSYDAGAIASIQDSDIQTALNNLIAAKTIPAPTSNIYYAVHFAPGVSITQQGSGSCVSGGFCAYHGTVATSATSSGYFQYGVLPDQGGGCAGGCGSDPSPFNNLCSVASHELSETVTDPAVGVATAVGSPLAWYDQTNGEIGDICNGQQGTTVGRDGKSYTIQLIFSNSDNDCVASTKAKVPVTTTVKKTTTTKRKTTTTKRKTTAKHTATA